EGIAVADRNAVAKDERCESGAQRKAAIGRETDQENLQPAAGADRENRGWIAEGEAGELAISRGQVGAHHLQNLLSFTPRELRDPHRRTGELSFDRDIAAREDRLALIENLARLSSHARSRVHRVELPTDPEAERVVFHGI